jgi:RNA polymerase-binding transcription factor DksA
MTDNLIAQIHQDCLARLQAERSHIEARLGESHTGGLLDVYDLTTAHALRRQLTDELRLIERALERNRQGSYGQCTRCRRPIWERMMVIPYAELCIHCQRAAEGKEHRMS